jgi:hypothetical protein
MDVDPVENFIFIHNGNTCHVDDYKPKRMNIAGSSGSKAADFCLG